MTNLGRLYAYAKGTTDAKEDFTREALAICIRHDPAPFIEALRDTGLIPPDVAPSPVMPFTQLSVPGVGRIDLVVRFGHGSGLEEWWFEAKVDAGESGDQLDRYRAHVASLPSAGRPSLISLARRPIRDDGLWVSTKGPDESPRKMQRRSASAEHSVALPG